MRTSLILIYILSFCNSFAQSRDLEKRIIGDSAYIIDNNTIVRIVKTEIDSKDFLEKFKRTNHIETPSSNELLNIYYSDIDSVSMISGENFSYLAFFKTRKNNFSIGGFKIGSTSSYFKSRHIPNYIKTIEVRDIEGYNCLVINKKNGRITEITFKSHFED